MENNITRIPITIKKRDFNKFFGLMPAQFRSSLDPKTRFSKDNLRFLPIEKDLVPSNEEQINQQNQQFKQSKSKPPIREKREKNKARIIKDELQDILYSSEIVGETRLNSQNGYLVIKKEENGKFSLDIIKNIMTFSYYNKECSEKEVKTEDLIKNCDYRKKYGSEKLEEKERKNQIKDDGDKNNEIDDEVITKKQIKKIKQRPQEINKSSDNDSSSDSDGEDNFGNQVIKKVKVDSNSEKSEPEIISSESIDEQE